jgi:hypothetical protein
MLVDRLETWMAGRTAVIATTARHSADHTDDYSVQRPDEH